MQIRLFVQKDWERLCAIHDAARIIGGWQIQSRASVGGNLCNASPAADGVPALLALDAAVELASRRGQRTVPLIDFYRLPGATPHIETVLDPGEVIAAITVPASPAARRSHYLKVRDRASFEFAVVSAAVALDMDGARIRQARVALGGVGTKPWRVPRVETALAGASLGPATLRPAAALAAEGAQVMWVDGDYGAAVRRAAEFAGERPGRALVQDTAWEGYEQVPAWIVQGYQTLLDEVDGQLAAPPDLVAVPVGVGSLAEAVVRHYRTPATAHPGVLSVEPATAACLLASLTAGRPVTTPTAATVMAGLNCGTVSSSAWPVLRAGCDAAVAVSDEDTLRAVDDLGRLGVSSGPSGAATLAGVRAAFTDPQRCAALDLPSDATVVLLSTEGRTR
jgi:diaminopropionate ammonia-lyase